jgi:hypothetical protein
VITEPPPAWLRLEDHDGVPTGRHQEAPVQVGTWDWDLLRHMNGALTRYLEIGLSATVPVSPFLRPVPAAAGPPFDAARECACLRLLR